MTFNLLFPLLSSSFLYDNVKILQIRFRKQYLMLSFQPSFHPHTLSSPLSTVCTHLYGIYIPLGCWIFRTFHSIGEIVLSSTRKTFPVLHPCINPSNAVCSLGCSLCYDCCIIWFSVCVFVFGYLYVSVYSVHISSWVKILSLFVLAIFTI